MGQLRLIKKGISIGRLSFVGIALVFCYLSKNTAWFTFLLIPFVLIFSLLHRQFSRLAVSVSIICILIAALAMLEWDAPLGWYQSSIQSSPLRISVSQRTFGKSRFSNRLFWRGNCRSNLTKLNAEHCRIHKRPSSNFGGMVLGKSSHSNRFTIYKIYIGRQWYAIIQFGQFRSNADGFKQHPDVLSVCDPGSR